MKKKSMRGIIFLMILVLCAGPFSACGSGDSETDTTKNEPKATQEATEKPTKTETDNTPKTPEEILASEDLIKPDDVTPFPISKKPIKLKFMKPYVMYDTEYEDLAIMKDYEKKTNMDIEWDIPPQDNFEEKYTLAMNTGNVPDAIIAPINPNKYGQQGAFIDLTDLIEAKMPNLQAAMKDHPLAEKVIKTDDGKIYSLPEIYQFTAGNNVMFVRKDMLDKNGIAMPETTEDWHQAMKTLKEKEGITPLTGYGNNGKGMDSIITFTTAWGVYPGLYVADKLQPCDNKVHYGNIEPRFREGIEWLAKLYAEDLIDPEVVTNDQKAFQAKVLQDKVAIWRGYINSDMSVLNTTAEKDGKSEEEFCVREAPIIKGPYGDQFHMWPDNEVVPNAMAISASNKHPEETAMWADYWYGKVGQTYVYGVENVTYSMDDKGEPQWTDFVLKNPDGLTMNEARGAVTFGRSTWPTVFQPWSLTSATVEDYVEEGRKQYRDQDKFVQPMVPGLSFTEKENDVISQKLNDIETYVDESLVNFIIGNKPMTEWDSYAQEVNHMGMDEVIGIYQDAYDRWQKR